MYTRPSTASSQGALDTDVLDRLLSTWTSVAWRSKKSSAKAVAVWLADVGSRVRPDVVGYFFGGGPVHVGEHVFSALLLASHGLH
jgi:hypothetical protein